MPRIPSCQERLGFSFPVMTEIVNSMRALATAVELQDLNYCQNLLAHLGYLLEHGQIGQANFQSLVSEVLEIVPKELWGVLLLSFKVYYLPTSSPVDITGYQEYIRIQPKEFWAQQLRNFSPASNLEKS